MATALQIDVRDNLADLKKELDSFQRTQMPFATARALTAVAVRGGAAATRQIEDRFDRPTDFTKKATGVKVATKATPQAEIYIKKKQASYLQLQETGGARLPKKVALVIPVGISLDEFGNMPRGILKQMKRGGDVFVAKLTMKSGHEIAGFWQRLPNHRLKLLAQFKPTAHYRERFGYRERVNFVVREELPVEFRKAIAQAMKTARRR